MGVEISRNLFDQIVLLLLVAAAVGAVAIRLRQPLLVGFIGVGILVGPSGLGWVDKSDQIHLLAELGLALLLFVVGLKLDVGLIRTMGPVALATGLGQVAFTTIGGYFICIALGLRPISALYVAVALTFSSTIIIVKLLSDKRETDSLHGRIAIGFLIVQDVVVVLAMIVLSAFGGQSELPLWAHIVGIVAKGAVLIAGLGLLMAFVIPRVVEFFARSSELLVLGAISWAVALAGLCEWLGFSKEVGAFLAGISLASTRYREILGARLVSLRDFLLLFFFIELGARLNLGLLGSQVWKAVPLSLFVLIGNPIIVMVIMGVMGYRSRTSFLAGLTVAQISEFSLILASLGFSLGHIDEADVGVVTLVGLVTIALSTYMILYSRQLYGVLAPYLRIFERKNAFREQELDSEHGEGAAADTILFGCGRYGSGIVRELEQRGRRVLGVDFDPQTVREWNRMGRAAWFGDAQDPEFPAMLPLSTVRWVVSAVPSRDVNLTLAHSLKAHGYDGNLALTAQRPEDTPELLKAGAHVVLEPFSDAAAEAADLLEETEAREKRRRMDDAIARLKDHYIVCGYGRMGKQIVKDLRANNIPYVVIEWNPEQIPSLIEHDTLYIEGKATDDEVLHRANINKAKGLIAVTATDEENVFIVLTARGLNPNLYIVARSIREENEQKLKRAGADRVMSPYTLGGKRIAAAVIKPRTMDFLDLVVHNESEDLEIGDLQVSEGCPLAGKSLREARVRQEYGITVLAIKRNGEKVHTNPDPDFVIQPGDELIVMGSPAAIDRTEQIVCGKG